VYTDILLSQAQSFACLVEQAACVHVTSKVAHQANQEAGYLSAAILKETNSLACHIDFAFCMRGCDVLHPDNDDIVI